MTVPWNAVGPEGGPETDDLPAQGERVVTNCLDSSLQPREILVLGKSSPEGFGSGEGSPADRRRHPHRAVPKAPLLQA